MANSDRSESSLRSKRKEQLRNELISCAAKLFAEHGYDAASVEMIVAAAGVAKGTFYLYFDSKTDIASAVQEYNTCNLEETLKAVAKSAAEQAPEALLDIAAALCGFFRKNKLPLVLLLSGRPGEATLGAPASATIEKLLRKGMLQGFFREVDAQQAASALIGIIASAISQDQESEEASEQSARDAVRLLIKGIGR